MITSTSNDKIKEIRKLQDRKARMESGTFFLEGLRLVGEAVQSDAAIEELVVAPDLLRSEFGQDLVRQQSMKGVPIVEVGVEVFRRISQKDGPQGIGAVVKQRWLDLAQVDLVPGKLWVALDAVADPGNLGTILRTNDGCGGAGVILLDQSTDPFDPASVRASMGALFDQMIVRTSFAEFSAWKTAKSISLVGTSDAATADYHAYTYPERFVLMMGSERFGLLPQALELCDAVVSIPMRGKSDSLNLAVATAVVLYEILNQRRDGKSK
jgi:RNA methyltransferase, TrmH family